MLSENKKNKSIEKSKFNLHLKDKNKVSEKQLRELLLNNNFDCDIGSVDIFGKWFLTDDCNNCYVEYSNLDDLNNFRTNIRNLKKESITDKLNYSKFNGHIDCSDCENCIFTYGKNFECRNCNYFKDCMVELEIDEFEREQELKLKRFYDRMENGEYPL